MRLRLLIRAASVLTATGRRFSTSYPKMASPSIEIVVVPMWSDNYAYLVIDKETRHASVVDPGEGACVIQKVKELEQQGVCSLKQLWCTHKHDDHAGGNAAFKAAFPSIEVIGTKYEALPALDSGVGEGDSFTLGKSTVSVWYVPCHTAGHIAFLVTTGRNVLFPGDTLFVGGCGRFFEGTGSEMQANMERFATLPPETLVYPAHEYTESNLKFLNSIDPEGCGAVYAEVQAKRANGEITVPTVISKELQYNLFIKTRETRVQLLVGTAGDPVATISKLREMKNCYK